MAFQGLDKAISNITPVVIGTVFLDVLVPRSVTRSPHERRCPLSRCSCDKIGSCCANVARICDGHTTSEMRSSTAPQAGGARAALPAAPSTSQTPRNAAPDVEHVVSEAVVDDLGELIDHKRD
jgi:hypothetical protein